MRNLVCFAMLVLSTNTWSNTGCIISPKQSVDIRSPSVGRLAKIYVDRGDVVKEGSILAELDMSVEQASVNSAKHRATTQSKINSALNKVNALAIKMTRMQDLYEAEYMSAQALEDAENELELAKSELKMAREDKIQAKFEYRKALTELQQKQIKSPFNGVVTERFFDAGAIVGPSEGKDPILSIAQIEVLKVRIIVPVKHYKKFKKGDDIIIVPEKPFESEITAKIAVRDEVIDSASGTFSVIAYIDNTKHKIPSGILCKVKELE